MATVRVHGRAGADVEPDRVRVVLAVRADAATAGDALALLAARSQSLDAALDRADLLLRRPSAVTVGPLWSPDGAPAGQAARRVVTVEARAAGRLGELVAAVSAVPGGAVEGVEWLVDPANPAHGRLRALAVTDARARAGDYAAAAGLRLGALERIAEPGPEEGPLPAMEAALAHGGGAGGPVLELRPEPVPVRAEVEVTYALLPGSQG